MVGDATGGGTYCSLRSSERSWEIGERFRVKVGLPRFPRALPKCKGFFVLLGFMYRRYF